MKKIVAVFVLVALLLSMLVSCGGDKVKITKSASAVVQYEKYDNGLVSLEIPNGWTVDVAPVDYIHYSFKVYDPKDPDYMLLFGLKQEGFLKSESARKTYAGYYPDAVFSKLTPLVPNNTEGFYKAWNSNVKYSNAVDIGYDYFPTFDGFEIIEDLGPHSLGGNVLRAKYEDPDGKTVQGLFTASVADTGSYYISTNIWDWNAPQVDVWPLLVYHIAIMTAPDEEFSSWQPILDHSFSTLQFSSEFIKGFNAEETALVSTIQANQKIYDSIGDMIMDSWEQRNASYDIISQKQSDATLGYERVYDTETGEVYKAYNGFTDDYSGNRYQVITDDMYTMPVSGYIEK